MAKSMTGHVCIVTGATRGLGKGIALQLGEAGATVYITGRTLKHTSDNVGGSLEETANEITNRGGDCIPVQCDHSKETDVKALFERVGQEQNGRLDLLVNNAYSAVKVIMLNMGKKFWDMEPTVWDDVNNVGLRNHYFCSVFASRMMVPRKQGLIVNISSMGGLRYLFNVPYGIGKEACDRMAADCAFELKKENVAFVSLWPGAVRTEAIMEKINSGEMDSKTEAMFRNGESTEFAGKCIVKLAADPNKMSKSGCILMTADLAEEYGLNDTNGRTISSQRCVKGILRYFGWTKTATFVPSFIKVPYWVMALAGNKFP